MAVERRTLMGVLAVPQDGLAFPRRARPGGKGAVVVGGVLVREPRCDLDVVRRRVRVRLARKAFTLLEGESAGGDRGEYVVVAARRHDDGRRRVTLRRGAHRRPAPDGDRAR